MARRRAIIAGLAGVIISGGAALRLLGTSDRADGGLAVGATTDVRSGRSGAVTGPAHVEGVAADEAPAQVRPLAFAEPGAGLHHATGTGTSSGALDLGGRDPEPDRPLWIRGGRTLARVNGVAITLGDLVPLEAEQAEHADEAQVAMLPDEYEARLAAAIDRELIEQAASARGVALDPDQRDRVAQIEREHAERVARARAEGSTWTSITPAQIAFEQRHVRALLLQHDLVAKAGGPEATDPRYAAAVHALLDALRTNGAVERVGR